jgi:hypothetical protein
MNENTTVWIWIILAAAVAVFVIVAIVATRRRARLRSEALRRRFGPEYERVLQEHGNVARAERELESRAARVRRFQFRDLSDAERVGFAEAWKQIQVKFVDDPGGAAVEADQLIGTAMRARGYPIDDFEHQAADLSVDHADVVQHYRAARQLTSSRSEGAVRTEELRQAIVHYRALFAELLEPPGERRVNTGPLQEAHGHG